METIEKRKVGRPKQHEDTAARVQAFRARAKYPGHRYDIYLGEDAHVALLALMKRTGLSASKTLDSVLIGAIKLPGVK
jgi:hypothetical protein